MFRRIRLVRVIFPLCAAMFLQAQRKEQPLGLVLAASERGSSLIPAGTGTPLRPRAGDLLFANDRLSAAGGFVRFVWCGQPPRGLAFELNEGTATIAALPPPLKPGADAGDCLLPQLERRPETVTLPSRGQLEKNLLGGAPAARQLPPPEVQGRLTGAVRLQQSGKTREAAAEYLALAGALGNHPGLLRLAQDLSQPTGAFVIPSPRDSGQSGAVRALVIGISKYEQNGIQDLEFADRDAEVFSAFLRTERGGQAEVIPLRNERARISTIRNHWLDLLSRTGEKDTLVLFIAAHGTMENGIPRVVTYRANPQERTINALPLTEIQKFLSGEKGAFREARVFLDVCHSGDVALLKPPARKAEGSRGNPASSRIDAAPNIFALTATHQGPDAFAYEDALFDRHGVFTYFLLRGLHSRDASNQQRILTASSLGEYVMTHVRAATNSEQAPAIALGKDANAVIADFGKAGLPAFDSTPYERLRMPPEKLQRKAGRRGAPPKPGPGNEEKEPVSDGLEKRIRLEDRGEAILLRYLEGDEIPQEEEDFWECARIFSSALELEPGSPYLEARRDFCLGRAQVFAKNYAEAVRRLENAIRLDPTAAYAYNALGIAYLERAEYATARLAFLDSIARAPKWAYPQHNLALTYSEEGKFELAERAYREAIRRAPDAFYLRYNLGLLYQRVNRRKEAETEYRAAIGKAPLRAEPLTALGQLQAERGRRREALMHLKRAAAMEGQQVSATLAARHNLALLMAADKATRGEAIRLWRGNGCHLPSQLSLAETLEKADRTEDAIAVYREILASFPDHLSARVQLAALLEKSGRTGPATAELEAALSVMPDSPAILEALGGVYARAGRREEARQILDRARQASADREARKRIQRELNRLGAGTR